MRKRKVVGMSGTGFRWRMFWRGRSRKINPEVFDESYLQCSKLLPHYSNFVASQLGVGFATDHTNGTHPCVGPRADKSKSGPGVYRHDGAPPSDCRVRGS